MAVKLEQLPPKLRKQAEQQLSADRSRNSRKDAESKCNPQHALEAGSQAPKISQAVYLVVLLYRTGQEFDLDNASIKPFLDGVVSRGMVKDDSCKHIVGLVKLPRQVKTKAEERTVMEFWDAEFFGAYIEAARRNAGEKALLN